MDERFDVIVVGGRCAGSSLAIQLARAGVAVCVVDRSAFPSDTPSTHVVQPSGVRILERLGVLDRLWTHTSPIERATFVLDDARIEVDDVSARRGAPMLNARRIVLDSVLLDAAADAGADVRTRTAVTGLVTEDGRVTGVTTRHGRLLAPLVVGADGTRSTVARLLGAPEYHVTAPERVFAWGYFAGGTPDHRLRLGRVGEDFFLSTPTDDGLHVAAVDVDTRRRDELLGDREAGYAAGLRRWPELADRLAGADRVGPVHVMARWHGFFRRSAGPGWVLVGDAGHFKDPTPGQGISDALRQSVTLTAAVQEALGGAQPDRVLRGWWHDRDRDAHEMYWFAHDMGAAGSTPPLTRHIQRRMADEPALAEQMLRVLDQDLPPSAVFTAGLAARVAGRALRTGSDGRRALLRDVGTQFAGQARRTAAARRHQPSRADLRLSAALRGGDREAVPAH